MIRTKRIVRSYKVVAPVLSRVIRLSKFMGRFGNQLGQYAFAKTMASRFKVPLECPDWRGRKLFTGTADRQLMMYRVCRELAFEEIPTEPGVTLNGYYQHQAAFSLMSRKQIKTWLTFRPEVLQPKIRPFYVAAHMRRGDYLKLQDLYATVERVCYERAITAAGYDLKDVVWVTDNKPSTDDYLPDFMTLMQADVLFRGNSTFSFWAGALGDSNKIYSPLVGDKVGIRDDVEFVLGNHCANFSTNVQTGAIHTDTYLPE